MKSEKIKKITTVFLIVVFVLIITVPLTFINKDPNKISVIENKKLACFPKFYVDNGKLNYSFISEFETYINDNIGFKEKAVVGDIAVSYKLFSKLKIPSYIMGEEDNLFYTTSGVDIETFQGKNLFPDSKLNELSTGFLNMQKFFEDTGANFYMMTIPNKEGVYPELYSKDVIAISDKERIDELVEYMKENTDINIFNIKQALINNKGKDMLYYKNYDCTHWNMNGAFVGYIEIINKLKQDYPQLECMTEDDFEIKIEKSKGSLGYLSNFESINNAMAFDDKIFSYNLRDGYHNELSMEIPEGTEVDAKDIFFHYVNKYKRDMPKIFIIGDSYLYSYLLPTLAENFSELYFINYTSTKKVMHIQNTINADIVLYEFVDRTFNDGIYDKLADFQNMRVQNLYFNELPVIEDAPILYIDTPVVQDNVISIDDSKEKQHINGWAIDGKKQALARAIYLKVGDSYYKPQCMERPDLTEEYLLAGYQFEVSTEELIKAGYIEFIVISNDGTYQYKPLGLNIKIK